VAAQDFPVKPIRIVVPFGPGTATDTVARVIANEMGKLTRQSVVVENKAGAEGQIGAQVAATAAPDGYTIFITTQTTQAINQHVYKSLMYDPVKSFAPVCGLTLGAQIVMVRNDLPVKTVAEFIALARKDPGKLSFGSGNGSSRGGAELFRVMAKIDLLGVPYKTQPQAITDLLGGRIDIIFSDFTAGLPAVLDGRARGIAVTSKKPIPGLEQFPTVDSTVPGFEMWAWTAAYVPAGTPMPIVAERPGARGDEVGNVPDAHPHEPRGTVSRHSRGTGRLPGERDEEMGRHRHRRGHEGTLARPKAAGSRSAHPLLDGGDCRVEGLGYDGGLPFEGVIADEDYADERAEYGRLGGKEERPEGRTPDRATGDHEDRHGKHDDHPVDAGKRRFSFFEPRVSGLGHDVQGLHHFRVKGGLAARLSVDRRDALRERSELRVRGLVAVPLGHRRPFVLHDGDGIVEKLQSEGQDLGIAVAGHQPVEIVDL
jgi:tripartite-type tricarboxylate transporter receptor subunit TctC